MLINHNLINGLPKPMMPSTIPASSQWLAGEVAGPWFSIEKRDNNIYQIARYSDKGLA